ncbi:MAG: hypothetical protein ABEH78_07925 [Haloferacaceae archaeon]
MPDPADDPEAYKPLNDAERTNIPSGNQATFTFDPDGSGMWVDVVAASKFDGLTYEVRVDQTRRFGPAGVPPTDIDDLNTTHKPPLEVNRQLKIIVRNPSATDRTVAAQVRGWET